MLFDLGGVVIDWNPRHLYRKVFGGDIARMEYFLSNVCSLEWNELQDAGRELSVATDTLVHEFPEWESEIRAYYSQWEKMIAGEIPGVSELLAELSDLEIRLFALSNWSLETFPLISGKFPALKRFEKIFLSGEAKSAKPDRRFYEYALKVIGLPRERLVFIDDNRRNVEAARALALPAIQFQDAPQLRRDLRAISLDL
jgi:2-haloacid dehalogenase